MRVVIQCKNLLLSRWSTRLALAIALLALFMMTMNYVDLVSRKPGRDDKGTASSHESEEASRYFPNRSTAVVTATRQRATLEEVRNVGLIEEGVEDQTVFNPKSSPTPSPPFIVILAQWRFGSSVIGELFNQNHDVFYLFEPLWLVDQMRRLKKLPSSPFSSEVHQYSTGVIRDIAACNVTEEYARLSNLWGGLINNRAVCEATRSKNGCKFQNADMINSLCSKFNRLKATKIIRADLDNIKPLIEDDKVNVKVIHLVRDPRGSAASRIHYYFDDWRELVEAHKAEFPKHGRLAPLGLTNATKRLKDCIPTMCKWMRETLRDAAAMPDWLEGRYHLLRYEDFATAPLNITEDLYQFVGLPLPQGIRDWVRENTEAKHSASGTFAVRKNSRVTAQKWLSDLSELEIEQVENECLDVMDDLGYERYATLKSSKTKF